MNRSLGSSDDRRVGVVEVPTSAVVDGLPETHLGSRRYHNPLFRATKRGLDIVICSAILLLLLPIFILTALAIAITDGFPVIIRHKRVGQHGKEIQIFKFRTMVRDADLVLKQHPGLMAEYEKNFKLDYDPRITKMGRWLRQSSVDEFPQLLNVIRGEMSLVGPRPIVTAELEKYGADQDAYLAMKPGCAGLWQCSGRSRTTYDQRVALDAQYYQEASTWMDAQIICRTFISMIKRDGAC